MVKKIYIGNMSYDTSESKLQELFAAHGEVTSVSVVTDRYTGRPRGFAFVEMATDEAAQAAITALNGREVDGRELKVNEANPPQQRGGGGGGGYGDRRNDRRGDRGNDRGGRRERW
ncbi:MAG: RNA-binding protein [Anaerolineae bacterium]|nr:RNA-binding protein [Anaerolineae bacterium]